MENEKNVIGYHDIMDTQIRSKVKSKEERQALFIKGYEDYHRLNYILKNEFGLTYQLENDRNLRLSDYRQSTTASLPASGAF